jgi:V-type H+-transporting ATPase subunit E
MGDGEMRVQSMIKFIQDEAKGKVGELEAQAQQAYAIEKQKVLEEMKQKANKEHQAAMKKIDTQRAISRSTSINKARLQKVAERSKYLDQTVLGVQAELSKLTANPQKYKELLTKLIAQGCLKLLEPEVSVRCRAVDKNIVESCLNDAESLYIKTLKSEVGVVKPFKLKVDPVPLNPPPSANIVNSCLGGVILVCHGGLITVDNTLDTRLKLVVEQDKPSIRRALFP